MTPSELEEVLLTGETTTVEFKRCGNQPERDAFETICSFSNRYGGSLFLGVEDNGDVVGVPQSALLPIKRNIINVTNNASLFDPPVAVEFEEIRIGQAIVLRIWVPLSAMVHRFKGVAFDRIEDADIRVTTSDALAMMYVRKQGIYSEQRIFPYLTEADLRLDRMGDYRRMAYAKRADHPWKEMSDREILKSMHLYATDYATGAQGFNRAAALLLGTDDVIAAICPAYKTDALLCVGDTERYDDRLTVATNLIDAYGALFGFVTRYLPDRFHLEGSHAISPRDIIVREVLVNSLVHREYLSPRPAQIRIERGRLSASNASRASFQGRITPDNLAAQPKNPIIARFFNQIGLAEELGSGTRALYKYTRAYSGEEPILEEGDVFRTIIPLPAEIPLARPSASARAPIGPAVSAANANVETIPAKTASKIPDAAEHLLDTQGYITASEYAELLGLSARTAQRRLAELVQQEELESRGSTRGRRYVRPGASGVSNP